MHVYYKIFMIGNFRYLVVFSTNNPHNFLILAGRRKAAVCLLYFPFQTKFFPIRPLIPAPLLAFILYL